MLGKSRRHLFVPINDQLDFGPVGFCAPVMRAERVLIKGFALETGWLLQVLTEGAQIPCDLPTMTLVSTSSKSRIGPLCGATLLLKRIW